MGGAPWCKADAGRNISIINEDLDIGITNSFETVEALADRAAPIERADHHRHAGRSSAPGERYLRKRSAEDCKSGLCRAITVSDSEIPVFNMIPPVMPLI